MCNHRDHKAEHLFLLLPLSEHQAPSHTSVISPLHTRYTGPGCSFSLCAPQRGRVTEGEALAAPFPSTMIGWRAPSPQSVAQEQQWPVLQRAPPHKPRRKLDQTITVMARRSPLAWSYTNWWECQCLLSEVEFHRGCSGRAHTRNAMMAWHHISRNSIKVYYTLTKKKNYTWSTWVSLRNGKVGSLNSPKNLNWRAGVTGWALKACCSCRGP